MTRKVYIKTWGCQMNEHDSQVVEGLLRQEGYVRVDREQDADLIYLNTCSVREKAEHKMYSQLGEYKDLKADKPGLMIAVGGCVAQQERETITRRAPYVDLVVGTHQFRKINELVAQAAAVRTPEKTSSHEVKTQWIMGDADERFDEPSWQLEPGQHSAMITVMEGCDQLCSFCIVPFTRGRELSRPAEEILSRARQYAQQGVREIMLLGQNVNAYGKKNPEYPSFARLLRSVCEIPGIERVRFTSPHPQDFSRELAEVYRDMPNLCPHAHIPVQAGNDTVLTAMKRSYSNQVFRDTVAMLRQYRPDIALTTDIIVGFPGETESQFADTLQLIEDIDFEQIFAFVYSPRPFTPARKLDDPVPLATKQAWLQTLNNRQNALQLARNQSFVGQNVEVLWAKWDAHDQQLDGRTPHGRLVHIALDSDGQRWVGQITPARVTRAFAHSLVAEFVH